MNVERLYLPYILKNLFLSNLNRMPVFLAQEWFRTLILVRLLVRWLQGKGNTVFQSDIMKDAAGHDHATHLKQ